MIIYVSRSVRILADGDRSFTIQRRHRAENGKFKGTLQWKNMGYYGRLDKAAQALLEKELCESNAIVQLKDLLVMLQKAGERLEEVCGAARAILASSRQPPEMHMAPEPEELMEAL